MSGDREVNPSSRDWERLYTAAILETDRSKLKSRIDTAQAAIDRRLQEMDSDHGGTAAERLEIETARTGLDVVRKRVTAPQNTSPGKE
jgi:hypothetical protein